MITTKLLPLALLMIAGCQSLGSPAAGTSLLAHDVYFALVDDGDIWIVDLQGRRPPRRLTVDEGDE